MLSHHLTTGTPSINPNISRFFFCSVLAMKELTDKADCVLPVENQVSTV